MAVTAAMVKELREMTGAGMMDCKKALTATNGNMDDAIDFLRKKGLAGAQKKAGRITAEGIVMDALSESGKEGVIVEVNSETDFVAKNEKFRTYVSEIAAQALVTEAADMEAFGAEKWALDETMTVKEKLSSMISIIGENMNIRRFRQLKAENGFIASYIHMGGKIGVLVDVETDVINDAVRTMAKNIAMQCAAMKPLYVSRADIAQEEIVKLRETTVDSSLNNPDSLPNPILNKLINTAISESIWSEDDVKAYNECEKKQYLFNFLSKEAKAQLAELAMKSKAEIMSNKMFSGAVEGRVSKQLKEICLLDQVYVQAADGKQSVAQYIAEVAKANSAKISVKAFARFETGEGLEKKNEDFAAEVAKQMGN